MASCRVPPCSFREATMSSSQGCRQMPSGLLGYESVAGSYLVRTWSRFFSTPHTEQTNVPAFGAVGDRRLRFGFAGPLRQIEQVPSSRPCRHSAMKRNLVRPCDAKAPEISQCPRRQVSLAVAKERSPRCADRARLRGQGACTRLLNAWVEPGDFEFPGTAGSRGLVPLRGSR